MKRKQIGLFDLGRIPITPTKYADDEKPTTTLAAFCADEARREQESADRLQNAIAEKQAEGSRIMKECLEVSAPLKKKFWLQPLDRLKVSLNEEEAFDELFLEKTTEDVDSNAVYDVVQDFFDTVSSLTGWTLDGDARHRFSLYVACQVKNDVIVTNESLLVMMNRCLSLGIFEWHSSFDDTFIPQVKPRAKPRIEESTRPTMQDLMDVNVEGRGEFQKAAQIAESLYFDERQGLVREWFASLAKNFGIVVSVDDAKRCKQWFERNNKSFLNPRHFDECRRWNASAGYWNSAWTAEELVNREIESLNTNRLTVAQRNDLNRRVQAAREEDARRFGSQ